MSIELSAHLRGVPSRALCVSLFFALFASGCSGCGWDEAGDSGEEFSPIEEWFEGSVLGEVGVLSGYRIRDGKGSNERVTLKEGQPLILDIGVRRYGGGPVNVSRVVTLADFDQVEHQLVDYQGVEYIPPPDVPTMLVSEFISPTDNTAVLKTVVIPYEYFEGGSRHDFRLNLLLDPEQLPADALDRQRYIPPSLPSMSMLSVWFVVNTPDEGGEVGQDVFEAATLERIDNHLDEDRAEWSVFTKRLGAFLKPRDAVPTRSELVSISAYNHPVISLDYFLWAACHSIPRQREMAIGVFNQGVLQGRMRKAVLGGLDDRDYQEISRVSIDVPLDEGLNVLQILAFPSPFGARMLEDTGCAHLSNILRINRMAAPAD